MPENDSNRTNGVDVERKSQSVSEQMWSAADRVIAGMNDAERRILFERMGVPPFVRGEAIRVMCDDGKVRLGTVEFVRSRESRDGLLVSIFLEGGLGRIVISTDILERIERDPDAIRTDWLAATAPRGPR